MTVFCALATSASTAPGLEEADEALPRGRTQVRSAPHPTAPGIFHPGRAIRSSAVEEASRSRVM